MPKENGFKKIEKVYGGPEVEVRIPDLFNSIKDFADTHVSYGIPELPDGAHLFVDATLSTGKGPVGVMIEVGQGEIPEYRIDSSSFESRIYVIQDGSSLGSGTRAESRRRVYTDEPHPNGGFKTKPFSTRLLDAGDIDKLMDLVGELKITKEVNPRIVLKSNQ